jgi:4-amino-4-deoxy-L-arabinose transferase-like glycosyltransferase
VLSKGPVGAALPALVIVGFLFWQRDTVRLRDLPSAALALLAATPVALWYGLAYRAGGPAFVAKQLVAENVDRFLGRGVFSRQAFAPLRLLGEFLVALAPWNLAAATSRAAAVDPDRAAVPFLHVWWIAILALFSVAAKKRGVYLLPLYPAVAVLAARWLERRVRVSGAGLAAAIVLFDLGMAGGVQAWRITQARKDPMVPFAATVRRLVPPGTTLSAAPGVPENDVIVLAYLLDRPIPRARPRCSPETAWLVVRRAGALLGDGGTTLVRAPGAAAGTALVLCR